MDLNLETLLPWSEPKRVQTGQGPRILRKAQPNEDFTALWRNGAKEKLKAAGIGWSKDRQTDQWEVCWWQPLPAEVVKAEAEKVEASKATDAAVDLPCPAGLAYLGYQKAGIAFALRVFGEGRGCLIADEMGLGKTIQAIGIINTEPSISRVLVICPASLKINWKREMDKWFTKPLAIGIASSEAFPDTPVVVINYDILTKWENRLAEGWDLLICDEAHYLKNPKSIRAQAVFGRRASRKTGEPAKPGIPTKRMLLLTGTPIVNRPIELHTLIAPLAPDEFGNWFRYAKRYAGLQETRFGFDVSGATNLPELQERLRKTCMVRRLKMDVLTELPAKRRQVIELPADDLQGLVREQMEDYEEWEDRLASLKAKTELAKVSDNQADYAEAIHALRDGMKAAFTDGAKIAHQIALKKVPYVVESVKELVEQGHKVVCFAHHLDVIDQLCTAFSGSVKVTGDVSIEDRQKAVDRFQTDPACMVFVGGIKAAGVGLTLTASSHVVFGELDWVPGNMCQAEDRTHRIGQANPVLVQMLVLEGSLDARKAQVLIEKMDIIDKALDRSPELASEPVVPIKSVSVTIKEVEAKAVQLDMLQIQAIHSGLRMLAQMCDGAQQIDGMGFNKLDSSIGKSLAYQQRLTAKQAVLGMKLVNKYRRQLPEALVKEATRKDQEK